MKVTGSAFENVIDFKPSFWLEVQDILYFIKKRKFYYAKVLIRGHWMKFKYRIINKILNWIGYED